MWCVVDTKGAVIQGGKTETSVTALQNLVRRWRAHGELVCAQEMGTQAYLVHDAICGASDRAGMSSGWEESPSKETGPCAPYWCRERIA